MILPFIFPFFTNIASSSFIRTMNKSDLPANYNNIAYKVVFSRRRTIGISVSPDKGVIIRAPFRTPAVTIEEIIKERSGWIRKHQEKFQKFEKSAIPVSYTDGSMHQFIGLRYILKIFKSEKNYILKNENSIEMGLKVTDNPESVKRLLYKWYKTEADQYFRSCLDNILSQSESFNFKPSSLVIRTMKRRWGSCSVRGKITLNTELIRMDELCINYVIVHELCHLRHHNHGKEFYALLSQLFPEWKVYRRKLKDHYL
jgi:predicted metal-dependent hydrolase